jgi:hypothetical protein
VRSTTLVVTDALWKAIEALPEAFEEPAHFKLLLDAIRALPDAGPAIVLAFTAIEVRVTTAVEQLAGARVDPSLWEWLNERKYPKDFSLQDYFGLLDIFTGHRLSQENASLWQAFTELKKIRNNFVHEGRLVVNKDDSFPVTPDKATELIGRAREILVWIEQLLPERDRRPTYVGPEMQIVTKAATVQLEPHGGRIDLRQRGN